MSGDESINDILASVAKRQAALREHLNAQPSSEITGVIYPGCLGGSGDGPNELWTFSVSLKPWRTSDGTLKHDKIHLIKEGLSQDELDELMDSMSSYEVIRVSAKFSESSPDWDSPQGLLENVIERAIQNDDLCRRSEDLKRQFVVNDPFFGKMKLDRSVNWLECKRRNGLLSKYKVCVARDGDDYDLTLAKDVVTSLEGRMSEVRDAVRKDLHEIYNDGWESVGQLTPDQFLKRIKLDAIVVEPYGASAVWFHDGGLFLGHSIEVQIDEDGDIESVNLAG